MKKLMLIIGIMLGLLGLLVLALPYLLDLNRYRDQYIPIVEQSLNRKVKISNVRMMWFPYLGIQLNDVIIYDDPNITQQPFVKVTSIELAVKWKPLFQRKVEVQSLSLHQPFISIINSKDLVLNVATLGKPTSEGEESDTIDHSLLGVFGVEQLMISDGTIHYEDHSQKKTKRYQLEQFEMKTQSVKLGDTAEISVQATLTPHQLPLSVEASFGPLNQNLDIPQIEALLKIGNSHLEASGQALGGTLDLDVSSSNIALDDVPIDLQVTSPVFLTNLFAHLKVPIGNNSDELTSRRALVVNPFRVQVEMGSSILKVTGEAVGQKIKIHGTSPVIHSKDLPVSLPLDHPVSIDDVEVKAQLNGALTHVTELTGKVFNGQLSAQGTWDGKDAFRSTGDLRGIKVEKIQEVLKPNSVRVDGTGAMHWNINGTWRPGKLPALFGHAQVAIINGQLYGLDLLQRIEQILKLKHPLSGRRGVTSFSKFQGEVEFLTDTIPVKSMRLAGHEREFVMQGAGLIKHDQSIAINGNLRLGDEFSKKIIQQMPVAKVALQAGRLVVPFTVNGMLSEPQVGLDLRSVQERLSKHVGKVVQDILRGDPKDVQDILKQGKNLLRGLFGN